MGFTKLDEGIVFSSIMSEDDSVFKVWTILLATCKQDGISHISSSFIEKITGKDEAEIDRCLKILSSPDKKSRSTNDEGKRIEKVDGGYSVINYQKYREFTYSDNPEAVKKRKQRDKKGDILGHVPDMFGHSASASASASVSDSLVKDYNISDNINNQLIVTDVNNQIEAIKQLVDISTWRTSYDDYVEEHDIAYSILIEDQEYLSKLKRLNPSLDVLLSLENSKEYWRSKEAWEHKKSKKSKDLNWESTYRNAVRFPMNRVFEDKPRQSQYGPQKVTNEDIEKNVFSLRGKLK